MKTEKYDEVFFVEYAVGMLQAGLVVGALLLGVLGVTGLF